MASEFTKEDADLLGELGVESKVEKKSTYTAREERIIAGFEDIQRFVEEHQRLPQHGVDNDIFERLYAVRLDRICESAECLALLRGFDTGGILDRSESNSPDLDSKSDEELLEALGVEPEVEGDISQLRHVRSQVDRKAAELVARREICEDFEQYRHLFDQVKQDLDSGYRKTLEYKNDADCDQEDIEQGEYYVLGGVMAYVASVGELKETEFERVDGRLRIIFANGTESNMLLRSFQRALYKTDNSRRISSPPPLFADEFQDGDTETGYIYVLRSKSDHPFIEEHRDTIHKIGVTGGSVKKRIANAKKDPTYLLADVEVVATYKLANVNRVRLERVLHGFLKDARLDVSLKDRFGSDVEPREWFIVPLPVIEEAVQMLRANKLHKCRYDPSAAEIVCDTAGGSN